MAYDERGLNLEEHRERPKERRRSDPSDKEAQSTLTLYDPTGRIIPTPKRNSSTISEQPRYQEEHVDVREYRRRNSDQVHSRDYRSTPPPKSALAAGLTESGNAKITSYSHPQVQPRLPASVPPPFQSGQASLDLQPAPSSTSSHIHPAVLQNSAAALSPIRTLYEHAWYQTVSNVQTEMTRMHRELVDAIDRERSAHSRLVEENKALQQDLERVKADLRNAHRDSDQLKDQCDRLMAENERLRQAVKDQIGQNDDQDHQVREAARSYIDEQLGQLKTQYGQQMEKQRAEAERALEQHKVMFEKERRELHKIAVAHERSMQRSGSESASTLVASDTEKVVSPFYDQGLHRNGGQQVSVHHDRPRGHRMSVSSGTKSPASSQTSPQVFSGSLPRCQSGSYRALSPLTPSIPPKEVFSAASPEDLICDLARTGDAVNVDVDVDAKRAVDNLASPIACPIPAPNAALLAMPSTSVHRRPVSSQSPACHLSSSRSPSVPLASIISQPLIDSPSAIGDREQLARPARPSVLPVTIPKARSRRSSLSNQIVQCVTPPMGSLGMRPYSQPPSRSVSRAASPSRPNNVVRPVLKVDVSPVVPPIAMLEELNPPLRQQQEPSSSLKTESQTLALTSAAQIQPQPTRSKSATPQPQQQHPRSVPLPPPPPPLPQQAPLKPQPAQPAQPLKQPTAQYTRFPPSPLPPPPLQPSQPSQNGLQKLPEKSQSQYTYQNYLPVHHQTGSKTWDSYPYTYHYQYSPAPLLPGSAPAPAALQATQSALGSFSTRRKRDRVEYEGDSGAGKRAKTKVKLEDGGGDESMATKVEVKEVKKANKIGITHMDLLYETQGTKMTCRMCRMPSKDEQKETPTMTFPVDAKWIELIGHCQSVHPKLCADLEKLSPSQVQELRQRMQSGKLTGYTLKS
ncbi:hypothetical protein C0993_007632 [Termitomyces sp. T159_Od127]|nr:hypothetical protein C0993_007632 [Termitomyces sp. T159_Od127]